MKYSRHLKKVSIWLIMAVGLSGCQYLNNGFKDPRVDVVDLQMLPSSQFEQIMRAKLRITNPNDYPLPLRNLSYHIYLDGHDLVNGTTDELGMIDANGSKVVTVDARVNLLRGAVWLSTLIKSNKTDIDYALEANLKVDLPYVPTVALHTKGKISLTQ